MLRIQGLWPRGYLPHCLIVSMRGAARVSSVCMHLLQRCARWCCCCADVEEDDGQQGMDCSALLSLQSLKVLSVEGWHLYITTQHHAGSIGTALMLTSLSASAWMYEEHEGILEAAVRGGQDHTPIVSTVLKAAAALVHGPLMLQVESFANKSLQE